MKGIGKMSLHGGATTGGVEIDKAIDEYLLRSREEHRK
jgi:hypothetical protein